MSGPTARLDPLYNAYRDDLADIALVGQLFAPRYAKPLLKTCSAAAPLTGSTSNSDDVRGQLAAGEEFAVLDSGSDWSWGYKISDHLVGYVRTDALG